MPDAHARGSRARHGRRGRLVSSQGDELMRGGHHAGQPPNQVSAQPPAAPIDHADPHTAPQLKLLPVVVIASLPCLTPLTLTSASATFLISDPLPLRTSTSRQ